MALEPSQEASMKSWSLVVVVVLAGCDRPKVAPVGEPSAAQPPRTDAAAATVVQDAGVAESGSPPSGLAAKFEAVVGDWSVAQVAGAIGLQVDGSRWRDGTPSANLADQAKRLYGDRYAEFLDGVKAYAFYPLAIKKELPPAGDIKLSVRFYPIAGKIDQAAGIAFGVAPDGSYTGVRANALEDNILYFKVVKGKRTIFDTVRNVPTPTKTWHTLAVELRGKQLTVRLDETKRFEKTLESPPTGHVGLWSKADSQVLFDDFEVSKM
jgi:hypothetical protein